jgi:hypothetical protein
MSIANANYKLMYYDIGTNGRVLDGVIGNTKFYEELNLPLLRKADNSTSDLPYVFVGDKAFALRKYEPFSQNQLTNERRVFNHRLSRARRVIENTWHQDSEFFIQSCLVVFHTTFCFARGIRTPRTSRMNLKHSKVIF